MQRNPFTPFLDDQGYVLLDGGLATQLESQGYDLAHSLWSARLLAEDPDAIRRGHRAFVEAGANCIISSSYQATPQGLMENGCSPREARRLIERSWSLAQEVCLEAASEGKGLAPVAAASIGPYGAYLADGSEYRGDYGLTVQDLVEFHQERFDILSVLAPLLAFETIPSVAEAQAIRRLLLGGPRVSAWVSFSCRDGDCIADGHSIEEAVQVFDDVPHVVAVGVNCTDPRHVPSLIARLSARRTAKEIVVYPNSGATYCADSKTWNDEGTKGGLARQVATWRAEGARLIGGCCRVTAPDLAEIAAALAR